MDSNEKYKVIGIMSGTSLDGIDMAYCIIRKREGRWVYAIETVQTIQYSKTWIKKLKAATDLPGEELLKLDIEYGKHLGVLVQAFVMKHKIRGVDFVASHGHTIYHQPESSLTFQLGSGYEIYAASGLPVVCDFRTLDVALGGQGAPLVPVGDKFLFHEYDVCLNLGGIANLSTDVKGKRIAYDICFVNMALNYLASKDGLLYDKNGAMAAEGEINRRMASDLNKVYDKLRKTRPSLSYEIFVKSIKPILDREEIPLNDRLATLVESVAIEIAQAIPSSKEKVTMLCTGGGAFNSFLVYRIMELCEDRVALIIPEEGVVKFKEALVFAFLGVLRVRGEVNCLKSVTRARIDSSSGVLIGFSNQ